MERGIIFSGEMINAILEGRKTMTRRIVKYTPDLGEPNEWCERAENKDVEFTRIVGDYRRFCKYGVPSDLLYVKESAWIAPKNFGDNDGTEIIDGDGGRRVVGYDASMTDNSRQCAREYGVKKQSPIFMPKWAARLWLKIVSVRVERLQEITEEDAKKEGVIPVPFTKAGRPMDHVHIEAIELLWDKINAKRGYSWAENPWVWVIEFRRIDK